MSSFKDNSGLEEHKPKATQAERDEQMKKFLAKGGKVEKLEPGYPLDVGSFDKSRKPRYTREEIKKGIKKDRYLSKEDAQLINKFIQKIRKELSEANN